MNFILDKRITIERKVTTPSATSGRPQITWVPLPVLPVVWANVEDTRPSRSESVKQGLAVAANQTRIIYRYRTDVDSSMRITIRGASDRVLQIVGGPAELGRHEFSEVVCEAYSS